MKIHHWRCASLLASVAFASAAQTPPAQQDPQAPNAAVPPLTYRSAFDAYVSSKEVAPSPDKIWMAANKEAGISGGHDAHTRHQEPTMPGAKHAGPARHQDEPRNKPQKEGK